MSVQKLSGHNEKTKAFVQGHVAEQRWQNKINK